MNQINFKTKKRTMNFEHLPKLTKQIKKLRVISKPPQKKLINFHTLLSGVKHDTRIIISINMIEIIIAINSLLLLSLVIINFRFDEMITFKRFAVFYLFFSRFCLYVLDILKKINC